MNDTDLKNKDIKEGWVIDKLDNIVDIRVSNVDKLTIENQPKVRLCNYMDVYSNDYITSKINFMNATAENGQIQKFVVKQGDVMITKDSETPDDIAIAAVSLEDFEDVVCGYHLALLKPKRNIISGLFLSKQLGEYSINRQFANKANGSTRYGLTLDVIRNAKIPFPVSLQEQERIAKIGFTVDTLIVKTQAAIEKYKAIKQGMLHDLFTRGLTANGQLRPTPQQAPELYKQSEFGLIPKEWEVKKIDELTDGSNYAIVDGPFGSNLKTIHYRSQGVPVIQSGFVTKNYFQAETYLYVDVEKFQSEIRSKVVGGDIVMAKIGAQCGTCAILPENHPVGIIAGNCLKITISKENSNIFYERYFHYMYTIGTISKIILTTAQPAVSMSSLKKLKVIFPNPTEQRRISEKINSVDTKLQSEEALLSKYQSIKKGLMSDLLSGKKPLTPEGE